MNFSRQRKAAACLLLMFMFNDEEEDVHAERGKTREWIKRRKERGYFNNIVEDVAT